MAEILYLLKLQKLDRHQAELERAKASLPALVEMNSLSNEITACETLLEDVRAKIEYLKKEQRAAEWDVRDSLEVQAALEKKLYSGEVTNVRELEQLQAKLETLKAARSRVEDKVIGLMERIEELESKANESQDGIALSKERLEQLQKRCEVELLEIDMELAEVSEERDRVAATISPDLLTRYNGLMKDKNGIAVAEVKGGTCGGCHMTLPTFLVAQIRPNNQVIKCDNCGRILCWVGGYEGHVH